jgi:transposase
MDIESQSQDHPTTTASESATLLISFELSQSRWVLTVRAQGGAKLSRFTVPARDTATVLRLLMTQRRQAKQRSDRPVRIVSIYEAGLDGFWLHRWLESQGIESHVVEPASILGPQRKRRAMSDGIDGVKLLRSRHPRWAASGTRVRWWCHRAWRRKTPGVCHASAVGWWPSGRS